MPDATTYTLNTNEIYNELEKRAEEKAEKRFVFIRSEKYEKILLAKLRTELKLAHNDKVSFNQLTDEAMNTDKYKKWLADYSNKAKEYELAKDKYNNFVAFKDMKITEESSARYLINKK
tara:strand:- start:711 stop:1067 length:357 start_codon:yes stop_codon:yes gene_type:complete